MNPKETKRVITELAACEEQLDTVLFDTTGGALGAAGLGAAGLGGAYLYGRRGLKKAATFDPQDIGRTIGRGLGGVGGAISSASQDLWENLLKFGSKAAKAGKAVVK
jgi:hypothetical protein